jgi:hypothetical protein
LNAAALDRTLARGVSPDTSLALQRRAWTLNQPAMRRELGGQLRRILRPAQRPMGLGTRVEPRRARVLAAEPEFRLLASRLESSRSVAVAGIAQVRVLLTDGCGPLYYRGSDQELVAAVREATSAL